MRISIIFSAAFLTVLAAHQTVLAGPALTVDEDNFDFGTIPQNCKVSHVFWLRSTGDVTLEIASVVPGCGCTEAPLQKAVLSPGDSTPLEVTFSSASYLGAVVKEPVIKLKGGLPERKIRFRCNVSVNPESTYPIVIKPIAVDLTQYGATPRTEARVVIANVSAKELKISVVSGPGDPLEVELPTSVPAGQSVSGVVRLKQAGPDLKFDKAVTLKVSDEKNSRFSIPIHRGAPQMGSGGGTQ
jgi:hypothetical protein